MQLRRRTGSRIPFPRRGLAWSLGVSLATISITVACEQAGVMAPTPGGSLLPLTPPVVPSKWSSPGGEKDSPRSTGVTLGSVNTHDGSVDAVGVPGTYTYRTIVSATFTGSVARTWNIPGQDPAPAVGPAGTGGTISWGSVVISGGSSGNGYVRSPDGSNVPSLTMFLPLQGNYMVGRSGIQQPSHDNPACGPQSSSPTFDCIAHSGTGTTASFAAVDVALVGWSNRTSAKTGDLLKYDIAPSSDVGGMSVSTDEIEWQWTPDDPTDGPPEDPGCRGSRHCEKYATYSGKMEARAYTNGLMKKVTVAHIDITDKLWLSPVPASGRKGFRTVVTAKTLDNTGLQRIYVWRFHPDSNPAAYLDPCGEINPCAFNVNASGTLIIHSLQGNQYKHAQTHLDVIPPSLSLDASKTQVAEGETVTFTGKVLPDSTPYAVVAWTWASDSPNGSPVDPPGGGPLASRTTATGQLTTSRARSRDGTSIESGQRPSPSDTRPTLDASGDSTNLINAVGVRAAIVDDRAEPVVCSTATLVCQMQITKSGTVKLTVSSGSNTLVQTAHVNILYKCPPEWRVFSLQYPGSFVRLENGEPLTVASKEYWNSNSEYIGPSVVTMHSPWYKKADLGFNEFPVAEYVPKSAEDSEGHRFFKEAESFVEFKCQVTEDADGVLRGKMHFTGQFKIQFFPF